MLPGEVGMVKSTIVVQSLESTGLFSLECSSVTLQLCGVEAVEDRLSFSASHMMGLRSSGADTMNTEPHSIADIPHLPHSLHQTLSESKKYTMTIVDLIFPSVTLPSLPRIGMFR